MEVTVSDCKRFFISRHYARVETISREKEKLDLLIQQAGETRTRALEEKFMIESEVAAILEAKLSGINAKIDAYTMDLLTKQSELTLLTNKVTEKFLRNKVENDSDSSGSGVDPTEIDIFNVEPSTKSDFVIKDLILQQEETLMDQEIGKCVSWNTKFNLPNIFFLQNDKQIHESGVDFIEESKLNILSTLTTAQRLNTEIDEMKLILNKSEREWKFKLEEQIIENNRLEGVAKQLKSKLNEVLESIPRPACSVGTNTIKYTEDIGVGGEVIETQSSTDVQLLKKLHACIDLITKSMGSEAVETKKNVNKPINRYSHVKSKVFSSISDIHSPPLKSTKVETPEELFNQLENLLKKLIQKHTLTCEKQSTNYKIMLEKVTNSYQERHKELESRDEISQQNLKCLEKEIHSLQKIHNSFVARHKEDISNLTQEKNDLLNQFNELKEKMEHDNAKSDKLNIERENNIKLKLSSEYEKKLEKKIAALDKQKAEQVQMFEKIKTQYEEKLKELNTSFCVLHEKIASLTSERLIILNNHSAELSKLHTEYQDKLQGVNKIAEANLKDETEKSLVILKEKESEWIKERTELKSQIANMESKFSSEMDSKILKLSEAHASQVNLLKQRIATPVTKIETVSMPRNEVKSTNITETKNENISSISKMDIYGGISKFYATPAPKNSTLQFSTPLVSKINYVRPRTEVAFSPKLNVATNVIAPESKPVLVSTISPPRKTEEQLNLYREPFENKTNPLLRRIEQEIRDLDAHDEQVSKYLFGAKKSSKAFGVSLLANYRREQLQTATERLNQYILVSPNK